MRMLRGEAMTLYYVDKLIFENEQLRVQRDEARAEVARLRAILEATAIDRQEVAMVGTLKAEIAALKEALASHGIALPAPPKEDQE